jgi:hypothetical protein
MVADAKDPGAWSFLLCSLLVLLKVVAGTARPNHKGWISKFKYNYFYHRFAV